MGNSHRAKVAQLDGLMGLCQPNEPAASLLSLFVFSAAREEHSTRIQIHERDLT